MTSPLALRGGVGSRGCIPPALLPPGPTRQWRVFRGRASELAQLRGWLAELLADAPAHDDVVTIAVELAGNAILHTASGRGGRLTVEIEWLAEPPTVRVTVADAGASAGPRWPRGAPGIGTGGYGLYLVRRLASRTGVRGGRLGRQVWAEVPWADPPVPGTRPGPGAAPGDG